MKRKKRSKQELNAQKPNFNAQQNNQYDLEISSEIGQADKLNTQQQNKKSKKNRSQ
jgi:hypothetical protein